MTKKLLYYFISSAACAAFVLSLLGCGGSRGGCQTSAAPMDDTAKMADLRIAYVRLDTLYARYQYYKDITEELTKEAEANRKQLTSKANALRKAAEDFDRKRRTNAFLSQASIEAEQQKLLAMQQQGETLEAKLTQEFLLKQQQSNEKLHKQLNEALAEYNKTKKYQFILTKVGVESILYADSAYDITEDVVKFLNSSYKKEQN
ncbi:OmpH family outer membrane protein [Porphyromonas crevioricanis]|uniref:OmpH family outer membrane protein n=1 Tax=Porphyromonas crevioricanis TaxID=393921 RepID=UPI0005A8C38C|nr:OmpH family outer membrane protein [Porphyromonas crevioricanis]SJZ65700.1 periplasmic chaperone for outer membrane proteins Skp [Porphyromonas crevioricanis]